MSLADILELVAGLLLIVAGVVAYRRRDDKSRGSQLGVLLIVFGLIALVLGFDLMDYRPSAAEIGQAQ